MELFMPSAISPTKLYHYTSIEKFLKYILPEKQLKFSRFGESRDPYEFIPHDFEYEFYPYWQEDYSAEAQLGIKNKLMELEKCWKNSQFLSFVMDTPNTQKGSMKPRMWEQYGNKHEGVCLEFSYTQIVEDFNNLSYNKKSHHKIVYKKNLSPFHALQDPNELLKEISSPKYFDTKFRKYFFVKDKDYCQENEYRFLLIGNIPDSHYLDISKSLTGIILGTNLPITIHDGYKQFISSIFPGVE
ncbi:MAG: DUF2971 domain-containing protein, partial [Spirochaetia bacterium]|nr:DUF2971 domain-containing protein [Spirochaetia bacterium]